MPVQVLMWLTGVGGDYAQPYPELAVAVPAQCRVPLSWRQYKRRPPPELASTPVSETPARIYLARTNQQTCAQHANNKNPQSPPEFAPTLQSQTRDCEISSPQTPISAPSPHPPSAPLPAPTPAHRGG
eukprot:446505-Rhodomonas_salina.4